MRISVLCDDTVADDRCLAEHGLSLLVELRNGRRWLLDTGTTDVFLLNADRMGIRLDGLAGIAISHGHADHTGGLAFYPRLGGAPPVFGHPYIWHKQYDVSHGGPVRVLGMPYMARRHADPAFRAVNHIALLDEDLYLFTDIPREPGSYAPVEGKFFNEDGTGPCPIHDDATLVAKTPRGLVALFGCAHAGYVNILKAVRKAFPGDDLRAVVGGLHLSGAGPDVLEEAAAYTDSVKTPDCTFHVGHCTGEAAVETFRRRFGTEAVKAMGAGRIVEF